MTLRELQFRAIFHRLSKVIWDCVGFTFWLPVIGCENWRHPLNQSDAKRKAITTWSPAFFPRFRQFSCSYFDFSLALQGISLSSDWPLWLLWFWFCDTQSKSTLIVSNTRYSEIQCKTHGITIYSVQDSLQRQFLLSRFPHRWNESSRGRIAYVYASPVASRGRRRREVATKTDQVWNDATI